MLIENEPVVVEELKACCTSGYLHTDTPNTGKECKMGELNVYVATPNTKKDAIKVVVLFPE